MSYSHRDKSWGEWLHKALEGYRIDKDLVGRQTSAGPVPNNLRPIFRDRDDFSAGHSLTEQTLAALEASQFLVVVCSPHAAASKYVNEEIRRFKALGGAERVVAIIVDGEPGDPARECFPPALRSKLGPDGQVTDEREEPIAADARRAGDGKRVALQKVVAALIGVPFDDVRKRDAIGDSRRIKIAAAAIGVVAALALFAAYLFIEHRSQQKQLADFRALAEKLVAANKAQAAPAQGQAVAEAVNAAAKGAQEGDDRLKRALDLLKANKVAEAEALFRAVAEDKAARIKQDSKDAAAAYRNLGAIAGLADPKRALDAYSKAVDLDPDDLDSLHWVGWIQKERGYLQDAEARLRRVLSVAKTDDQAYYQYWARLGLGDIRRDRGDLRAAQADYREAATIAERLAKAAPNNAGWQRDLSVSNDRIGDVLVAQGNLSEALKFYRDGLAIVERLAKADPNNAGWQRDLSVVHNKVGDVRRAQGDLAGALTSFHDGLGVIERLAKADPNNAEWQRDLSVSYNKVGDVLVAQGHLPEALKSYRDGLAIRERLAKADPKNAGWQYDLGISNERIGDVLMGQGDLAGALTSYQAKHSIISHLAKADPNNAGWQRDLSVAYEKIGDVLKAQGNLAEALKYFKDDLAIAERLARADLNNADWQRDLSVSYERVADVLMEQGQSAEALKYFRDSLTIRERLAKSDTSNVTWQWDMVRVQWRLATHGDDSARRWGLIVVTLRTLKQEGKLTAEQGRWLPEAEARLAKLKPQ